MYYSRRFAKNILSVYILVIDPQYIILPSKEIPSGIFRHLNNPYIIIVKNHNKR